MQKPMIHCEAANSVPFFKTLRHGLVTRRHLHTKTALLVGSVILLYVFWPLPSGGAGFGVSSQPPRAFQKEVRIMYLTAAHRLVLWNGSSKLITKSISGTYGAEQIEWLSEEIRKEAPKCDAVVLAVCWGDAEAGYRRWLQEWVDDKVPHLNGGPTKCIWLAGIRGYVAENKVRVEIPDLPERGLESIEADFQR